MATDSDKSNLPEVDREDRLAKATARANLGLWECDPATSRFWASDVVQRILEVGPETELARVSERFRPAAAQGRLARAIALTLDEGRPFSFVSEFRTATGQQRWIRTQGQLAPSGDARPSRVFGTIQDISEIRLLDRVTQESEMTLNQVEAITHIGHWSVSLTDGSFFHSDEIKRIFGYEPSEYTLSVEEAINAYHPDDRDEVIRLFNRAVETGQGYEFDLRVIQPSGAVRYVHSKAYTDQDQDGTVTRVFGVFQDVTERELAAKAQRESEASMKALVDGVSTAIVVHAKDGEILLSNPMADRLLAPLATDLVGKTPADPAWRFIYEDGSDIPVDELPVSRILRTGEPVENLVMGRRDSDDVAWLLVNGRPVVDGTGALSKVIISFIDITLHREMDERLHQAEKMRAIGQLAGGIAHDFNNQLMVMRNYAELLVQTLDDDSVGRSFVEEIIAGVARSGNLTRQLLAFARRGKNVVTTVDMNRMVAEVVSMARHSFDKKIRITQRTDAQPATVSGDVSQLQNALLNMALNSRDAMPDGGELTFATDAVMIDERGSRQNALDLVPGEYVRVTIRDDGLGMDAATRKQMFEPFFTTKAHGKGTGMGMASVYGTVKSHHGAIEVDSVPGRGTSISLFLPLIRAREARASSPTLRAGRGGGRIMVVDDERLVARTLRLMLERQGYEVTACMSGREALAKFERAREQIDLVLLDMVMPDMSGAETFTALRAIDPRVKVILISGFSFNDEARRITESGAAGFLAKPFEAQRLYRIIAETLVSDTGLGDEGSGG